MTPTEPMNPELLVPDYAAALREYVSGGGEAALTRAYELGRTAASRGLGILNVAMLHREAMLQLPPGVAGDRRTVGMATQFLAESLSPFEMTFRSYQANARLLGLSETLARQNEEIDRSREQLRAILDATTAVIYLKDADGRYLFVNRQFQEAFGVGRDDVIGKADEEVLPATVARTLQADDGRVLGARAPQQLEETVPGEGGPHTYLSLKFPLLDPGGAPYAICCVATDITERKRGEEALQRAREAAERERQLHEAVRVRDEFLGIASHELKTPLTSLELQVASLQRLAAAHPGVLVSDERIQSKCESIVRQVERLTGLINNLIDVGRITSGRLALERERVDLGEVVHAVLERSREAIRRSGSKVAVAMPAPVVGTWDRSRLETVVTNLLSNAVKFGNGKPIEISIRATANRAVLAVRDQGIGVSAEDQKRIFDRFERAVSRRHFGGFGLGLWVAREAVEAHGGTIRVQTRDGAGSEFTVELPLDGPR
ncbi:MAG TPA: ATP-binding protein [Anaeromyxobacter sp.]